MVMYSASTRVRSLTVGRRLGFEGTILGPAPGSVHTYYVQDEAGEVWSRFPDELTLIPTDQPRRSR